jgi:hypothetical protein
MNNPPINDPRLKWAGRFAYLLDEQFRVPGTNFRFGLDPVLNLVPVLGDMSGFALSAILLLTIARNGASSKIVVLMCLNIVLDATIGAIPVIGQIFDFFYKANSRNMRLLREHYQEGKHQGSGVKILVLVSIFLLLIFALLIWGIVRLFEWLF